MWPDAIGRFIARGRRRLWAERAALGIALGLAIGLPVLWFVWRGELHPLTGAVVAAVVFAVTLVVSLWRAPRSADAVARDLEVRAPEFCNRLTTAVQIRHASPRVRDDIRALIWGDTARVCARVDLTSVIALRSRGAVAAMGAGAWIVLVIVMVSRWPASPAVALARGIGEATISAVRVAIAPPAYTGDPLVSLQNPDRVDARVGSRLQIHVTGHAARIRAIAPTGAQEMAVVDAGEFAVELPAASDGYLAFEPVSANGIAGVRTLVSLAVRPDRPPDVRITAPAKDLFFADTSRPVPITVVADDDLALRSLRMTFTKVSGSGEDFTFTEGELPLRVTKTTNVSWRAETTLSPAALGLVAGDTIVYRALATDSLPGRQPVESEGFVVEILAPTDVAAEGFATGDDRERYALSEQMIIVKTEQLQTRRPSMPAAAFTDEAIGLAAMQRSVRATFVFMLGGELEDTEAEAATATELHEENEAAGEQDLLAGRMQNQGRQDVLLAIRRMSEASTSLVVPDTATALVAERAAVAALQRAFTKSRYILRTLSVREEIDPTRRLTGDAKGELTWRRDPGEPPPDQVLAGLRRTIDDLGDLAGRAAYGPADRARATTVAESIVQLGPGNSGLQQAAARVVAAARAMATGQSALSIAVELSEAAVDVTKLARARVDRAPAAGLDPIGAGLAGALSDQPRRRGGGQ